MTITARRPRSWPPARRCLDPPGSALRAAGPDGPPPTVRAYPSEVAEALGIAAGVRQAQAAGRRWADMAVLTRTNAQLLPVQEALAAVGIPSWTPARRALLDDPITRRILAHLHDRRHAPMQMVAADLVAQMDDNPGPARRSTCRPDRPGRTGGLFRRQQPDGNVAQWLMWLPTALARRLQRIGSGRRRDALQLSPRQRARMGGGMGRRPGARTGAHRPGQVACSPGGGAPPSVRRPDQSGGGVALLVGAPAQVRHPPRPPRPIPLAGVAPLRRRIDVGTQGRADAES